MNDPQRYQTYLHTKSGKSYMVMARGHMKFNGTWYPSVNYSPLYDNADFKDCTRTLEDFVENFHPKGS